MPRALLALLSLFLPWPLRRWWLGVFCGYRIAASARIGFAWVSPVELTMGEGSRIGAFTVVKSLRRLELGKESSIGRGNWITGYPEEGPSFRHQPERRSELILGAHAAITHRHIIDCTGGVIIGEFTTLAGYASQILTHSIDLTANRQNSGRVEIGRYCFVGTNCVILASSRLPDFSVLGAKALLNQSFTQTHALYAGIPVALIKTLPHDLAYFQRKVGFVE